MASALTNPFGRAREGIVFLRQWLVLLLGLLPAFVILAGLASGRSAGAVELVVRSRTSTHLQVANAGRWLLAQGELRDNLFQGLSDRPIYIRIMAPEAVNPDLATGERRVTTDRNGRFRLRELVEEGPLTVTATFAGDEGHTPSSSLQSLTVSRRELELAIDVPVASPFWADIPIAVRASSPGHPARWSIDLVVNEASLDAPVMTDDQGRASLQVSTVNQRGPVYIDASFPGDDVYGPAAASASVLLYEEAAIDIEPARIVKGRDYRLLVLQGEILADRIPIAGAELSVSVEGGALRWSVTSDEEGRFELVESIAELDRPGEYRIRVGFDPHGTGDPAMEVSAEARVTLTTGPLARVVTWATVAAAGITVAVIGLILAGQLVLLARSRRRTGKAARPPGQSAPRCMIELAETPRAARRECADFGGRVRDADTFDRVGPGEIQLQAGEDHRPTIVRIDEQGEFAFRSLAGGQYRARTRIDGYMTTTFSLTVPHRGEYSQVEVFVASVRAWVRFLYQEMTDDLDLGEGEDGVWGRLSPRQIEERVAETLLDMRVLERETEAFERTMASIEEALNDPAASSTARILRGLTLMVEEVYYSDRLYGEDVVGTCRALVQSLKQAALDRGGND